MLPFARVTIIGMGLIGVASTAIVLWQPRAAVSRPGE